MASSDPRPDHLVWTKTTVDGRAAVFGVAGEGLPVVFVHGWALAHRAYKRALKRLVGLGCRVYAPALPGFGGSPDLPDRESSVEGYAHWLAAFLDSVGVDEPVFLVGHSFGGAVSIKFADEHPDRVRTLVLVNSVGGSAWDHGGAIRSMTERPLWDWGLHLPRDILPLPHVRRVLPVIMEDLVGNLVRNPRGMWRAAQLVRKLDLTDELESLRDRGLPVVVLWGDQDKVIPRASFDALCAAIGAEGEVISGRHSWLIADPDSFGEVMTNIVEVARLAREQEQLRGSKLRPQTPREIRHLAGSAPPDEQPA